MPLRPTWMPDLRGPHIDKRICFFHVPKCAGSSLVSSMRKRYRLRAHLRSQLTSISAEPSLAAAQLLGVDLVEYRKEVLAYLLARPDLRFVTGHVGCTAPIVERYAAGWSFVTVLRDPVGRFLSEYFYNRYKESTHFATRLDFDEYLHTPEAEFGAHTYLNLFSGLPRHAPDDERVEDALANVRRFHLVGYVDDLDAFRRAFEAMFRVPLRDTVHNTNPAPEYDALRKQAEQRRAQIEEMCAGDLAFYRRLREGVS